jgi:hypothetical protein
MKFIKPATINTGGFTRATVGTYFDSTGTLQTAAVDVPRFTHTKLGVALGALIEAAATNTLINSKNQMAGGWTNLSGWARSASTAITGIDGTTNNITKWTADAGATPLAGTQVLTAPVSGQRCFSLWVYVPVQTGANSTGADFWIVWTGGSVPVIKVSPLRITANETGSVLGRWVRMRAEEFLPEAHGSIQFGIDADAISTPAGFHFYTQWAQEEAGTYPTSEIDSGASPTTRAADVSTSGLITNAVDEVISPWLVGTTYSQGQQVIHLKGIFESRIAGNVGNPPSAGTTTTPWLYVKPVNSVAMFDQVSDTQTTAPELLSFSLQLATPINALAFLNTDAATISVSMTDPVEGLVYERTVNLSAVTGINNWWRWLYSPIDKKRDVVFLDLPLYANAVIAITINNPGSDAKCGVCVAGLVRQLGISEYGTSVGLIDYSKITEDDFGNRVVTKRGFAKRINVPVAIKRTDVDYAIRVLQDTRQLPMVWIAAEEYESTIIYGPYKTFEHVITTWGISKMQLEIQGLR